MFVLGLRQLRAAASAGLLALYEQWLKRKPAEGGRLFRDCRLVRRAVEVLHPSATTGFDRAEHDLIWSTSIVAVRGVVGRRAL